MVRIFCQLVLEKSKGQDPKYRLNRERIKCI